MDVRHLPVCRVSCSTDSNRFRTLQPGWSSVPVDKFMSPHSSAVSTGCGCLSELRLG